MDHKKEKNRLRKQILSLQKAVEKNPKLQSRLDAACEQMNGLLRALDRK